eukprot:m.147257 g.147257  ORF g.147257 m.147257 type:complete len:443 (-) comp17783_c0_seq1:180-1508(-)
MQVLATVTAVLAVGTLSNAASVLGDRTSVHPDYIWTEDDHLSAETMNRVPLQQGVPKYTVDLDAPAETRWNHIAKDFVDVVPDAIKYLKAFIPPWAFPLVIKIAEDIEPYFSLYADEMKGLAKAYGIDVGDIVVMNLIYQVESIGLNCSTWNNTGPTVPNDPGCMAVDPSQKWCYCHNQSARVVSRDDVAKVLGWPIREKGPGLCTSVVAEDREGHIFHGRNLDWNLPLAVRKLVVDVDFQRGGETVFTGTTAVGFVGIFNGMRKGVGSVSIDARGKGGTILDNALEALLHKGSLTPSQNLRKVLEDTTADTTFDELVTALGSKDLIDEVYYITGGTKSKEGAVVARTRLGTADVWRLDTGNTADGWYRLQTNYDHWEPVPKADDRRTPGRAHMNALGRDHVGLPGMHSVMTAWPTFNHHTDYTGYFAAFNGTYESTVWTQP